MHLISTYHLTTLLAVLPAFCAAGNPRNGCVHYRVTYIKPYDLKARSWPKGSAKDFQSDFDLNAVKFVDWTKLKGVADACPGVCYALKQVWYSPTQWTWQMTCEAARMNRWPLVKIPDPVNGITRQPAEYNCDVNCSPNHNPNLHQTCDRHFENC
ncbi:Protein transport protein [Venturia nashicola]|nr:Protein transport protein [Venturia nashicola]